MFYRDAGMGVSIDTQPFDDGDAVNDGLRKLMGRSTGDGNDRWH
jgi:hypothetical protein